MHNQLLKEIDWPATEAALNAEGYALTPPLLDQQTCAAIAGYYSDPAPEMFRSTINMARYNFGQGQYRYFDYPLPNEVQTLRAAFYPHLAAIANRWAQTLRLPADWPPCNSLYK